MHENLIRESNNFEIKVMMYVYSHMGSLKPKLRPDTMTIFDMRVPQDSSTQL